MAALVAANPHATFARVATLLHPDPPLHPGVHDAASVAPGASLGAGTEVAAQAVIGAGARCIVQPGAVIGGDGFGFANDKGTWIKVPQIGSVVVGDDVEIGANTTIDRGAIEDTVIEDGVKLDNLIMIAHNCRIGAHSAIAGCTGIAGSASIGLNPKAPTNPAPWSR